MLSVLIFSLLFYTTLSFNIDVNLPVVRQNDQIGSYFGFSVAQHQWFNRTKGANENWLLVGAPKANVSEMLTKNIVNPGAVYKCDLEKDQCEQLAFDTSGNQENAAGKTIEDKSNMWFGVSLFSSGLNGKVLACAHRYLYKGDLANYHMYPGRCLSDSGKLNMGRGHLIHDTCKKLNDEDATKKNQFVSVASYVRYQYCQMGVSAVYVPEYRATLFGAPGSMKYQGLIFYKQSRQSTATEIQNKSSPFGYQGFSTSTGSFFKPKQIDIVTGAPRYNHHGMVVVFERDDANNPKYPPRKVILPTEAEGHPQPGSGFGYSVVGVDVNNDSMSDILVGAPYYSVKDSPNEGRVFVYMNKGSGVFQKTLELAPRVERKMAQFGHVVAGVGDLDQDGYEDVAVGAPYENDQGVVYVFNGSADGLSKKPAQIIKSSDIPQNPKTFGYSIAGHLDMDNNGYPDILIGAYASDGIVLLRSKPIIDLQANITITPNPFDIRDKSCRKNHKGKTINTACMLIKICLGYNERKGKLTEKLSMDLSIESDVKYVHQSRTKKEARIMFSSTNGPYYNKTLTNLPVYPATTCFYEGLYLRENVKDIYPDILFKVNYKMHQPKVPPTAPPTKLPSLAAYAILEEKQKTYVSATLKFKRDCVKCEPNLHISSDSPKTLAVGKEDYQIIVTVTNSGESAYNTELLVTVPEGVTQSSVWDVTNEDKEPLPISHLVSSEVLPSDNSSKLAIPVANPLRNSVTKKIEIRLNTGSFTKSQDFLAIDLEVMSSNKEPAEHMADNVIHLNITIVSRADLEISGSTRKEQISYGGKVVGESAMVTEEDVGSEVRHTYIVQNLGPDLVPEAEVVIQWPYEAQSGKHLLYLMNVTVGGRGECDFLPGQINLLNLLKAPKSQASKNVSAQEISIRNRRDAEPRGDPDQVTEEEAKDKREVKEPIKGKPNLELDCKTGTARCTPIRCTIKRLRKGDEVSFVVRARIWNGTLLEDYYGKLVEVISRASVKSSVTFVQEIDEKNNMAEIRNQFKPDFPPPPSKKLASWVIPVAVVGAILALIIIILILWKLGFFKRKRFDGNMTDAEAEAMMADSKQEKKPFDH